MDEEIKCKCEEIFKLYNELNSLIDGQQRNYNGIVLYPAEIHMLALIEENQDLNVTELAMKQNITKGALSKMVSKLIKKGLLVKFQQKGNSKNVYLHLTDLGKSAYNGHQTFHAKHNAHISPKLINFVIEHKTVLLQALDYAQEDLQKYLEEMHTESSL